MIASSRRGLGSDTDRQGMVLGTAIVVAITLVAGFARADAPALDAANSDALAATVRASAVRVSVVVPSAAPPIAPGSRAPPGTVSPISSEGEPKALDFAASPITVVNFWATWCPPCVKEMPELGKAAVRYAGRVRFIGLASADSPADQIAAIVNKSAVGFEILRVDEATTSAWRVRSLPTTYVVDASGTIRWAQSGALGGPEIDAVIGPMLGGGAPPTAGEMVVGVGFAIRADVIATARANLLTSGERIQIFSFDGRRLEVVGLLADDEESGIALIKIGGGVAPLPLASSSSSTAVLAGDLRLGPPGDGTMGGAALVTADGGVVGVHLAEGPLPVEKLRTLIDKTRFDAPPMRLGPNVRRNMIVSGVFFGAIVAAFVVPAIRRRWRERPRKRKTARPTAIH